MMPDPFISQQDLSDYLGRDVTNDAGALMAVDAACDVCRDFAEQDFNAGTATISLDGTGTDALLLPQQPVSRVGTVTVNGGTVTDWMLSDEGMLFRGTVGQTYYGGEWGYYGGFSGGALGYSGPVWPRGRQNVSVTYEFGYVEVPRSVRMVAISLAARLVVQGPAQSETVGDVQINYGMAASDLTTTEKLILDGYRQPRS